MTVSLALGRGVLPPVVPMWLVAPHSAAHSALVAYKAAPSRSARARAGGALVEAAGEWLARHLACLVPPSSDTLLVPVPSSTGGRPSWHGRHPLEHLGSGALEQCRLSSGTFTLAPLLVPGPVPPRRLQPRASGFVAAADRPDLELADREVVIFDDLFVSGARAASAAAALAKEGATVRAIVVLARLVRPDHNLVTAAFWATYGRIPASPGFCPVCAPAVPAARSVRPCATRQRVAAA